MLNKMILKNLLFLFSVLLIGCSQQPKIKYVKIKEKCLPIKFNVEIPKKITFKVKADKKYVKIQKNDFVLMLKNYNLMKIELQNLSNYIKIHNKIQNNKDIK